MVVKSEPNFQFFNRVLSLPFMTSTVEQMSDLYTRTKQQNRFLKYTIETAESALKFGAETAKPIIFKITPTVIDNFACQQLDRLEKTYPVIKKPVPEIVETSRIAINNLKSYGFEKLNNAKQYGYNEAESYKRYSYAKIKAIKDYELIKISSRIDNNLRKLFHTSLNSAVTSYEKCIDYYLPLENEKSSPKPESDSVKNLAGRVIELNCRIPSRIHFHAHKYMLSVSQRTQNKINELQNLITLLKENSYQSIKNCNERVQKVLFDLNKEGIHTYQIVQKRLLHRARLVTKSLINIFNQASTVMLDIPDFTRQKFVLAKMQFENLYTSFKQVRNVSDISNVTLENLQEFLTTAVDFTKASLPNISNEKIKSRSKNLKKKES